ncbi:hypothetical protein P7K49_005961 [Saguinus oedipus]|uniref:Uncharacterized protein n=1 Tax=Saguinus oedipus TaxID=9490 RepID=A0ABQ9W1U6_SAGOE|nr:hypothetical protein P7K49_005961 [Saguinus oedipus]
MARDTADQPQSWASSSRAPEVSCAGTDGAGVFFLSSAEGEQISFLFDCIVCVEPGRPGGCARWAGWCRFVTLPTLS